MTRLPFAILALVIVIAVVDQLLLPGAPDSPGARRPAPGPGPGADGTPGGRWTPPETAPAPEPGEPLEPASPRDPSILINIPAEKRSATGTAFSIDPRGVWLTARHVADSCRRLFIVVRPGQGLQVQNVYVHPTADIALLRTRRGAPNLPFADGALRLRQAGYHYGFPKGEPAAVASTLIGRRVMRVRGRYRTDEPVVAWAERTRVPESFGGLGGISGGPALDAQGRIVGITVAGTERRGRVYTTAPASVRAALRAAKVDPPGRAEADATATEARFAATGERLREKLTVARVLCFAGDRRRQGNPRRPGLGGGPR